MPANPDGKSLRRIKVLFDLVLTLRELHILRERMNIQKTLARAEGAIAVDRPALRFAFRLLDVERRREFHRVLYGAAMAVQVVRCVDAIGFRPGDLGWCFGVGHVVGEM